MTLFPYGAKLRVFNLFHEGLVLHKLLHHFFIFCNKTPVVFKVKITNQTQYSTKNIFRFLLRKFKVKLLKTQMNLFNFEISFFKQLPMSASLDFNQMLLSNAESLKPFAVTLTHDTETAKDLFQETLYRALANKEKYNVGTNIKAWLYTIMRNIFINNYRRKSKQQIVLDSSPNNFLLNSISIPNAGVASINMKEIQKIIFELPFIFKKPFLLFYEGFRYHEIAEMLDEPLGTIKSRIHFARKLLKAQIERF